MKSETIAAWVIGGSIAAFAVIGLSVWATLNAQGFCWKEGRFLSKHEIFRNLIQSSEYIGHDVRPFTARYRSGREDIKRTIPYEDIDQFFRVNSDCCEFASSIHFADLTYFEPPWYFVFSGKAWKLVSVKYQVFIETTSGDADSFDMLSGNWSDTCGHRVQIPREFVLIE
ncbi:hypothetical protein GGD81_002098 [Rhodobium orientis]|uniref:hypothetical protein n=1 Tax=Rhodobium orientis TaxID=34017 RepID=UPI0011B9423D|nr:hypothetical protein [Rhodobium orientis]MBB4303060.1 hypothetical protein [Rhodobium orientis]